MQSEYFALTYGQVALAAGLVLLNAAVSLALQLRYHRTLLIASARTVTQLLLLGLVLRWVFQIDRWYVVVAILSVMTWIAGATAAGRARRRYPGLALDTLLAVWLSCWVVSGFALLGVLRGIPSWHDPQYAIPLTGMILGNTLNGVSLGLNAFTEALTARRAEVDTLLALGATRWEAARSAVRHAVRSGMIPITNAMMVVGLVSLPGMMTGQLLSGVEPIEAVKYQIVIMFLIAAATTLGTVASVLLSYRRLFNSDHQFLAEELTIPPASRGT